LSLYFFNKIGFILIEVREQCKENLVLEQKKGCLNGFGETEAPTSTAGLTTRMHSLHLHVSRWPLERSHYRTSCEPTCKLVTTGHTGSGLGDKPGTQTVLAGHWLALSQTGVGDSATGRCVGLSGI
jgi:hypothetical protein